MTAPFSVLHLPGPKPSGASLPFLLTSAKGVRVPVIRDLCLFFLSQVQERTDIVLGSIGHSSQGNC